LITLPGLVIAQTKDGTRRVALLLASTPATASHFAKALGRGLAELGWVEVRNLRLEVRYGENDAGRFKQLAAELLALRPDVFVAGNEPVAQVIASLTKTVPIVVALSFDPVGAGLVQSLARPGGNVTGLSTLIYELMPKRLQLLKQAVPGLTRVAVMYPTEDGNAQRVLKSLGNRGQTTSSCGKTWSVPDFPGPAWRSPAENSACRIRRTRGLRGHNRITVWPSGAGALTAYFQESSQALGGGIAIQLAGCHVKNQRLPRVHVLDRKIRIGKQSVSFQKYEAGGQGRTLVAIDKRMIAAQVIEVGRGNLNGVPNKHLAAN
jgi:hypothetical protein